VNDSIATKKKLQSITTEEFFYFFLRMRKGEVKRIVGLLQSRYPDESSEQLAKRLIASKSKLSLLGGTLVSLPALMPGVGSSIKLAGIVSATSMLTRMNLYLINEIALAFGEDIDDTARISDMVAVVGATAISSAAPSYLGHWLGLTPWAQLPAGALSSAATTQMIGRAAIRHFRRKSTDREGTLEGRAAAITVPKELRSKRGTGPR
jgi:hypothetical protein